MKFLEIFKIKEVIWLNIFIRDILLVFIILWLHYITNFNSKSVFLITGMMVVWITWQFSDFMEYINYKRLSE
jgi:hypothetical protein